MVGKGSFFFLEGNQGKGKKEGREGWMTSIYYKRQLIVFA